MSTSVIGPRRNPRWQTRSSVAWKKPGNLLSTEAKCVRRFVNGSGAQGWPADAGRYSALRPPAPVNARVRFHSRRNCAIEIV